MSPIAHLLALMLTTWPASVPAGGADAAAAATLEVRGHVVCVDASRAARPCDLTPKRYALQTREGKLHVFLASDSLTGMFEDEQVRERELLVRARTSASGEIETIKVYSLRDGRLHDLDYFCEVCNVVAYAPGLCVCCRQPLVLRERRLP